MSSYTKLERALVEALTVLRDFLGALDSPPNNIEFEINADGRVLDGDLKVTFKLSEYNTSYTVTKGGDLTNVIEEFARRYGWTQKNDALYLPKVSEDERREHTNN